MDAHALLTSQGWRGTGHSLHATSDDTGLRRPLLVSQKQNVLGVGKKQHKTSDLWWMNAFDKSLKGLDTSKEGHVVQTVTSGGLDMVAKGGGKYVGGGGLYACFVKGETLTGSLTPEEQNTSSNDGSGRHSRRKERNNGETKQERRARKEAKRATKAAKRSGKSTPAISENEEMAGRTKHCESKEDRKKRKVLGKAA